MLDWRVPGYRTVRELRAPDVSGRSVLAVHEASGLPVALRYHASPDRFDALRADARLLAGLSSPHIAPLYEHIEVVLDGVFGVATVREYVPGASVRSLLTSSGPAPALVLLRAILLALRTAHAQGLTHGHLTAENVVVDAAGTPRVTDFFGTPAPTPPEPDRSDFPGNSESSPRSGILADVGAAYALFAAAAGKLPKPLRGLATVAAAQSGEAVAREAVAREAAAREAAGSEAGVLLTAVEAAGPAAFGADWQARGTQELARLVAKHGRP